MRKAIAFFTVLMVLCSLSSCSAKTCENGYEDGYLEGFDAGYNEGVAEAQQYIAFVVDDDLRNLGRDIEKECGMHPGEAVEILANYADVPDEVTEEELHQAIMAIYQYYYKSHKIVDSIDDHHLD